MNRVAMTAMLAACAGAAMAQPVIDGAKDASYGPAQWVNSANPTGFGDNIPPASCNDNDLGNPGAVTTGLEWAIPLSAIGNPTGAIKIGGFVSNGGYGTISNQIIGGVPAGSQNLGAPATTNFNSIANNQYVSVSASSGSAPAVDGTLDAVYGTPLFTQTCRTSFGNSDTGSATSANGSEIDAVYAVVRGDVLYVFVSGNLNSDFTKLSLLIDSVSGGQNVMLGTNPDVDFNGLNNLAGLTFDSTFSPDYWFAATNGGTPTLYANYARLRVSDTDAGEGYYMGSHDVGAGAALGGGTNPNGVSVELNNSNIAGVSSLCPPPVGTADYAGGSEIDAVYATCVGSKLYLLVTGNMQSNFNKLDLFFDVDSENPAGPGGQHTLRADNVDIDFNGLNRYGQGTEGAGLTFDGDFAADYWLSFTNGGAVNHTEMYSNASPLRTDGPLKDFNGYNLDYGAYDGGARASNNPIDYAGTRLDIQGGNQANIFTNYAPRQAQLEVLGNPSAPSPFTDCIAISLDNSNIAGVTGTTASDASSRAVTTGVEYCIRLDEIGWDRHSPIRVAGWIANGGHSYVSNQILGGIPAGAGNVGESRAVDFNSVTGTQFLTLNVTPCAADYNADGSIDFFDYLDFVNAFSSNDSRADFNHDLGVDFFDYLDFVDAFSRGC